MYLTIAIVGRPNVGKSTLFNRMCGKKLAIVHDEPGVTRDRKFASTDFLEMNLRLIDTPGLDEGEDGSLKSRMVDQTREGVKEADICLFVVDAMLGKNPDDTYYANWLRKFGKPVILIANKAERHTVALSAEAEFAELGFGEPLSISASHGQGLADLAGAIAPYYDAAELAQPSSAHDDDDDDVTSEDSQQPAEDSAPIQIAIVGRPNAGKSTLINALIKQNRMLTGPEAGITRDSVGIDWTYKGVKIKLVDTAGMRRRTKVTADLEQMSVSESLHTIRFAQVVVLLMDAESATEKQDLAIARLVEKEGRVLIVAVNKWDKVTNKKTYVEALQDRVDSSLSQIEGVPVVTISALHEKGLDSLISACIGYYHVWNKQISTSKLNKWLEEATSAHMPPLIGGRRLKLKYINQTKSRPPTFLAFGNIPDKIPDQYTRYLVNSLRGAFDLAGVPIRFNVRKTDNPYAEDNKAKEAAVKKSTAARSVTTTKRRK